MEDRIAKLDKEITELISENSSLKQDITFLKNKISTLEKKNLDYVNRLNSLEKQERNTQIQKKLTNSLNIKLKHDHKGWILILCILDKNHILSGGKDGCIKCHELDNNNENSILFTINKAHDREVSYILKLSKHVIISCGEDGRINRWYINYSKDYQNKKRYKLLETFMVDGSKKKVHQSAYKIIKLNNGNLCSCGKGSLIRFWEKNKEINTYKCYKYLKCEAEYVQSVMELDNNKLVAGCWHSTEFFDIKEFKAETNIKKTMTDHPNAMIRMGDKIICSGWGIFFIDIKKQQLISTVQIEYYDEEGIYCLAPLTDNLFICGGNLRTLDIYDINICEKVANISFNEDFAFDIKNYHGLYFICGSVGIYGYFLNEFLPKKKFEEENEKSEESLKNIIIDNDENEKEGEENKEYSSDNDFNDDDIKLNYLLEDDL